MKFGDFLISFWSAEVEGEHLGTRSLSISLECCGVPPSSSSQDASHVGPYHR
ncbi:unnamed protein product [Nesidiocoris tenuis]|uniref:Uncharacterized protein n=1 Tax=Nesidiocoris tenuis TaxID=355587 RepID=A0A6H5GM75_9HEMI|nr:unnamed protein product [Nesidiocoris tenuis]